MEVGAVKQAFNNEIILLKKNLNQAKIQTIHKLTRKAKTLTEKKAPETLKEKLKRKAESAVKEVLIIKKIKARDIARFIVTHTGKLNDYLNKAEVDNNKACARLLLHKSMQEKYKHIRAKFSNISIKDLFMSRQERLKLKKEAREKKKNKNKKKEKDSTVSVEGEWDVEDSKNTVNKKEDKKSISDNDENDNDENDNNESVDDLSDESDNESDHSGDQSDGSQENENSSNEIEENGNNNSDLEQNDTESSEEENIDDKVLIKASISPKKNNNKLLPSRNEKFEIKVGKNDKVKLDKKVKENKNKNLNEKLQKRKFNKESEDLPAKVTKIVDPFFKTSTGDNYMSLVEPRAPDEVKESHKQGNRQYRRAVMFGHVPKIKPKKNNFQPNNNFNKQNNFDNSKPNTKKDFGEKRNSFNRKDRNDTKDDAVPEKLHPSWEAKKKQSGILPFQGKKIVFD